MEVFRDNRKKAQLNIFECFTNLKLTCDLNLYTIQAMISNFYFFYTTGILIEKQKVGKEVIQKVFDRVKLMKNDRVVKSELRDKLNVILNKQRGL